MPKNKNNSQKDNPEDPITLSNKLSSSVASNIDEGTPFPSELPSGIDSSEYTPYTGENVNPYTQDLRKMRAQEQGFGEQLVNFGGNLAAEVAGGTIEGAGYILGLPEMALDKFSGREVEFGNAISEAGKAIREGAREKMPIYTIEEGGFNPTDTGWWFSNGVSIVSTLSLLLPALGTARGVSVLGKGLRGLAGLSKGQKGRALLKGLVGSKTTDAVKGIQKAAGELGVTGETLLQAGFSRHAENLMEAAPLFEEKYQQYIDQGLSEDVARKLAGEAASNLYKWNSLFLLQDIGTFGLLGKASRRIASKMGRGSTVNLPEGPSWASTLTEIGTEGAEEAYQYATGEEARILADQAAGIIDKSAFSDRLSAYANGDMITNAMFGALGAGAFRYIGSRIQAYTNQGDFRETIRQAIDKEEKKKGSPLTDNEKEEVATKVAASKTRDATRVFTNFTNAAQRIDEEIERAQREGAPRKFLHGMKAIMANIKGLEGEGKKVGRLDELLQMDDQEFQENVLDKDMTKKDIEDFKYVIDKMENIHKKNKAQFGKVAPSITFRQSENLLRQRINQERLTSIEESKVQMPNFESLESKGKRILDATFKARGIKQAMETISKDDSFPNKDKILGELADDYQAQQSVIADEQSTEQKGGEQKKKADKKILDSNETAIQELSDKYEAVAISNAAMSVNQKDIESYKAEAKKLEKEKSKKQDKKPQDKKDKKKAKDADPDLTKQEQAEQAKKEAKQPYDPDLDDYITTPVNTVEDVEIGDDIAFAQKGKAFEVVEQDGEKGIVVGGEFNPLDRIFKSTDNYQMFKITTPEQAERESKETLDDSEVTNYSAPVPDVYEKKPQPTQKKEKSDVRYLSWISANSDKKDADYRKDPEVVARTNWAESVESIEDSQGKPKYYLEFDAAKDVTAEGRGAIKGFLHRVDTGEVVTDAATGVPVSFFLDAPSGKAYDSKLAEVRQKVLSGLRAGETVIAPLTSKSEGMWRYGTEDHDVRTLTNISRHEGRPDLFILRKDRTYRNSKGQLTTVGLGNKDQIGRVYTVITGLEGTDKVVPLERKKLDDSLVNTAIQITRDIINGTAPGNTISEEVKAKMTSSRAEGLFEVLGKNPTNQELLNYIVLEGSITQKLATHKRFHIEFTKGKSTGTLHFGDQSISFSDFRKDDGVITQELANFLSKRDQNVMADRLGQAGYDNYLLDSNVLQQNIEILNDGQILFQPDLRFGEPVVGNAEEAPLTQVAEETSEGQPDVTYKGNPYQITDDNKVVNLKTGKELDPSSSYARAILAKAAEEGSPQVSEANKKATEKKSSTISNLEAILDELLGLSELYQALDEGMIPEENGMTREEFLGLENLSKEAKEIHDYFINKPDSVVNKWITGKAVPDPATISKVENAIKSYLSKEKPELTDEEKKNLQDQARDMFDDDAPFQRLQSDESKGIIPVLNTLKKRFGFPYVLIDDASVEWNGVFDNGVVFINLARAGVDTAFHEYVHPVLREIKITNPILYASLTQDFMNNSDGKSIYARVKKAYPEYTREQVLEESMVQLIGQKSSANQAAKSLIERIWSAIKRFFNSYYNIKKDISDLSSDATLGDIAQLMSGSDFIATNAPAMVGYSRIDSQMTYKETNSWINSMMYILLSKNEVADYTDADKLDFTVLREFLQKRIEMDIPAHTKASQQRIMDSLFGEGGVNENSPWFEALNDKLAAFDIVMDERTSTEIVDDEGSYEFSPDYLFDGREKAASFVRMLFSTVPKVQSVRQGKNVYDINEYTGMPEFHSFNDIWNLATKALAGVVEKEGQTMFETFIEEVKEYTNLRPELKLLVNKLEQMPTWKKKKFVQAFYKVGQNYSTLLYRNGQFQLIKNDPTPAEEKVKQQWLENFNSKWLEGEKADREGIAKVVARFDKFAQDWSREYKRTQGKPGPIKTEYVDKFLEFLEDLGLETDERIIEYVKTRRKMSSKKAAFNYLVNEEGLNRLIKGNSSLKDFVSKKSNTPVEDQQAANIFIEANAFFKQDLGTQSVFGPGNNTYYNYSNFSMIAKLLQYYKDNPDLVESLKEHSFYKGSQWLDKIDKLTISNNIALRKYGREGKKMSAAGPVDRLVADINKTLRGQFGMIARGANATEFNISGPDVIESYMVDKTGTVSLNPETVDMLMGYVYDELLRSYDTQSFIENEEMKDRRVDGYHTAEKAGLRSFLMPKLNENTRFVNEDGTFVKVERNEFIKDPKIREQLQKDIRDQVNEVKRFLRENGLTREGVNNVVTSEKNYQTSNNLDAKLYDYITNGIVANIEQQKLFAADTAMFATGKDAGLQDTIANMQKRILANGSMGLQWDFSGQEEFYRSAVIAEPKYDSKSHKAFKGIDIADAQAWVTMDFYIDALKGYGYWTPEHDVAYQNIQNREATPGDLKLFMQPLKTVHFQRAEEDGLIRPVYDKQTILPLVPQVVENTSLNNLLINMKAQNIDHVTVESGKKLGRVSPTEAVDPETNKFKEDFQLNGFTQSKRYTFLQTEMPTKQVHQLPMGSQQRYNILSGVMEDLQYEDKNVISEVHRINNALSDIQLEQDLNSQITDDNGNLDEAKLRAKLIDLSQQGEIDRTLIDFLQTGKPLESMPNYNLSLQGDIMSLVKKAGVRVNHSHGLRLIQTSSLGFDKLSKSDFSDIKWLVDNPEFKPPRMEDGELKPGQMLISHSILDEYDVDINSAAGKAKLREILSGVDYRIPNQAPSNIGTMEVIGILPEYMGDTVVVYPELNEKSGSDNDGDKVELMLYNYGKSDERGIPGKVKYWSDEGGDKEATLEDIYDYRTKKLDEDLGSKEDFVNKYLEQDILLANAKDGLGNYLIDMYKYIMSTEGGFDRMMNKLESDVLEKAIKDHMNYDAQNPIRHFEAMSPFYQVKVRDSFLNAKSGVGQISNHILDHVKSQHKEIYVTDASGDPYLIKGLDTNTMEVKGDQVTAMDKITNVDGKRISDILSQFMNSQVDAEKDDYAAKGNFNTETNSVAMAMIRAGARIKDVVDIIGSDQIRAYARYQSMRKSVFVDFNGDPLQTTLKELNMSAPDAVLKTYIDFENVSKGLSTSIQQNKFSVNAAGGSFASAMALESFKYDRVPFLANTHRKWERPDGGPSMEENFFKNSVMYAKKMFGKNSLAFSQAFHDIIENLEKNSKFEKVNLISGDTSQTEKLYRHFYGYLMGKVFDGIDSRSLITGKDTVAQRVRDYEGDNALINYLVPTKYGNFDMLKTSSAAKMNVDLHNTLSEAWEDLYREDRSLAMNLAAYAYFQSNYNRNLNSFYEFMPSVIFEELNFQQAYNTVQKQSQAGFEGFVDQYIRNNIDDPNLVPTIDVGDFEADPDGMNLDDDQILVKNDDILGATFGNAKVQYVKFFSDDGPILYERIEKDIFQKTVPLGISDKGIKFYEYNLHKYPVSSMFRQGSASAVIDGNIERYKAEDINRSDDWVSEENNDESPLEPNKPCK